MVNRLGTNALDTDIKGKVSEAINVPFEAVDSFVAETIVRTKYREFLRNDYDEMTALNEAGKFAGRVMADRSKGALPLIFTKKNPVYKLITAFQVEGNNTWSNLFKDMKNMSTSKIDYTQRFIKTGLAISLVNEIMRKLRGSDLGFDFFKYFYDFIKSSVDDDDDISVAEAGVNLAQEVVEDLPFIPTVLAMTGLTDESDSGGKVPIASAVPDITQIIESSSDLINLSGQEDEYDKNGNVTKSISGLKEKAKSEIMQELSKPLAYLVSPTAGGQIRKTYYGAKALLQGGDYTYDENGLKTLKYPVENTAGNWAKGLTFGKWSLPTAQDYLNGDIKSLSAKNTESYKKALEAGISTDDFYSAYNAQKNATSDKDENGKTVNLSKAKNQKKAIDEAVPNLTKTQKECLYEAFGISNKVWK